MEAARHIDPPDWMSAPATTAVLRALTAGGGSGPIARFVGGCVRDAVLGRPSHDIDIAVALAPREVMARLAAAGVQAVPTGIDHGTITAIAARRHFEITSLRADVETYGRRAKVAFTDDWAADAARRDFTINALYADPEGTIYDPTGGLADLAAGRVRFVGRAAERIREDALRILRFFRFYARFGGGAPDAEALGACRDGAAQIAILSGERVAGEFIRLLAAADPVPAVRLMVDHGVLAQVLPAAPAVDRLSRLVRIEAVHGLADPWRRLAALLPADGEAAERLADRLRLSNAERDRLVGLVAPVLTIATEPDGGQARRLLYRLGAERFRDLVLLAWADGVLRDGRQLLELAATWEPPRFPLRGNDVRDLGLAPGPEIGRLLREVEEWWVAGGFHAGREPCLAQLKKILGR